MGGVPRNCELALTVSIFVDEMGNLIKPGYITDGFARLLRDNHLRRIRFHDLRHSCASLLLTGGVPMKQIQEWLGQSDFSTTANIYAHLDYSSKITSAEAMLAGLEMKQTGTKDEKIQMMGGESTKGYEAKA